ncbi:MAG TPA: M23 family metallopeptidase [Thermoanaerobaculia bacterium]|nr:M23 family metallopeptidase [Thermoanaerobaculia bacterium]
MRPGVYGAAGPILATGCGLTFAAGLVAGVILAVWIVPPRAPAGPGDTDTNTAATVLRDRDASAHVGSPQLGPSDDVRGTSSERNPPPVVPEGNILPAPSPSPREVESAVGQSEAVDSLATLIGRGLAVPVLGVQRDELHDSFAELRGGNRRHEAIDILASRNTPVVAVEDGIIAKLFTSHGGGGLTIYQFDVDTAYAYSYAHLERFASGLVEGERVRRGQVIGYVGTSGNAPPDTPHLHFAVYRLTEGRNWWEGDPLNPYEILRPERRPVPG